MAYCSQGNHNGQLESETDWQVTSRRDNVVSTMLLQVYINADFLNEIGCLSMNEYPIILTRLAGPRSNIIHFQNCGSASSEIHGHTSWPLCQRGGRYRTIIRKMGESWFSQLISSAVFGTAIVLFHCSSQLNLKVDISLFTVVLIAELSRAICYIISKLYLLLFHKPLLVSWWNKARFQNLFPIMNYIICSHCKLG